MRTLLTYPSSEFVLRQTPMEAGRWGTHEFVLSPETGEFAAWAVYEDLPYPQTAICDANRTVFITAEPSSIRRYHADFLAQFAAIVTPQPGVEHRNIIYCQPAIPWWVGISVESQPGKTTAGYRFNYDNLKAMTRIEKQRQASLICSSKVLTEGHRARVKLVEKLREKFEGRIDFYGYGSRPVIDKWDAIAPYRYHIVIENTRAPHYWTEKLADAYLGGSLPVYCGCPNIGDYFPKGSYWEIDRYDPNDAVERIERLFAEDPYAQAEPEIMRARNLVLDQYNLFPMLTEVVRSLPAGNRKPVRLLPHRDFVDPLARRMKRAAKRLVYGVGSRSG